MAAKLETVLDTSAGNSEKQIADLVAKLQALPAGSYNIFAFGKRKRRTLPANAYYWGVVLGMIAKDSGNEPDDLHEHFKRKYNATVVKLKDEFHIEGGSTARLASSDFWDYISQVKQFALDFLNVRIPEPNEIPDEIYLDLIRKGFIK